MAKAELAQEVRERPIIFSGRHVVAILLGRKTQTRRVVKWKLREEGLNLSASSLSLGFYCTDMPSSGYVLRSRDGRGLWNDRTYPLHSPHGAPDERLWVREALWVSDCGNYYARQANESCSDMEVLTLDGETVWRSTPPPYEYALPHSTTGWSNRSHVREGACEVSFADCDPTIKIEPFKGNTILRNYKAVFSKRLSPYHMPRRLSRLTLEIESVRIERLKDVTPHDACGEYATFYCGQHVPSAMCVEGFTRGWDTLNAKRGFGWDTNPWVWVLSFRRMQPARA